VKHFAISLRVTTSLKKLRVKLLFLSFRRRIASTIREEKRFDLET